MVFSCRVDADFLETEAFYAQAAEKVVVRGGFSDISTLRAWLAAFMTDGVVAVLPERHRNVPTW